MKSMSYKSRADGDPPRSDSFEDGQSQEAYFARMKKRKLQDAISIATKAGSIGMVIDMLLHVLYIDFTKI